MLYLELLTELGDHFIVEICTIIRYDPLWYTVSIDQIVPNETCHNVLGYRSKGSCFNPLYKVITRYQDETMLVGCRRSDLAGHINASHCKRPRCCQNIQRNWRNMHLISIDLALVTCPRMLITVGFHCGPVISCPKDFLCHGMSTGMRSEGAFMQLCHDLFGFCLIYTMQ